MFLKKKRERKIKNDHFHEKEGATTAHTALSNFGGKSDSDLSANANGRDIEMHQRVAEHGIKALRIKSLSAASHVSPSQGAIQMPMQMQIQMQMQMAQQPFTFQRVDTHSILPDQTPHSMMGTPVPIVFDLNGAGAGSRMSPRHVAQHSQQQSFGASHIGSQSSGGLLRIGHLSMQSKLVI